MSRSSRRPFRLPVQRGRTQRGTPNKTESAFANEILEPRLRSGECIRYRYEGLTFARLPGGIRYTPDYVATMEDGSLVAWEVKASWDAKGQQAARLRLRVAAVEWPEVVFMVALLGKRGSVRWKLEEIVP